VKILLIFCLFASFLIYHNNTGYGPDSFVYRAVAKSIVDTGSLNILPMVLNGSDPVQVTNTHHAPIHQNVGGVVFILPATLLSQVSAGIAALLPGLPPQLYDTTYHEQLWLGGISFTLALISCLLIYRVACLYHRQKAVVAAVIACFYGGPLLIYSSVFTCGMNLPTIFLASLLLFTYHFADLRDGRTWLLLGAIWSLGTFVRSEFVIWGLLLVYGLYQEQPPRQNRRKFLRLALITGAGGLLFLPAAFLLREVTFGSQGTTYASQFDYRNLWAFPQLLFGWRNGLFSFWPLLLIALFGYLAKWSRNPPVYHVLFLIMTMGLLIFSSTLFWSGELGDSFGQRRVLLIMPIFILYLARLLDTFDQKHPWLLAILTMAIGWALFMFVLYGQPWRFTDGTIGLLMPHDFPYVWAALTDNFWDVLRKAVSLILLPKHIDIAWLLPFFALLLTAGLMTYRHLNLRTGFKISLAFLIVTAVTSTLFLLGAGQRGERVFREVAAANPVIRFVNRNYDIDGEMLGSFVDSVSYYLELNRYDLADHFQKKGEEFFAHEAPETLPVFTRTCNALLLRKRLGWYRLVPEQSHLAVHQWYDAAVIASANGLPAPNTIINFRY